MVEQVGSKCEMVYIYNFPPTQRTMSWMAPAMQLGWRLRSLSLLQQIWAWRSVFKNMGMEVSFHIACTSCIFKLTKPGGLSARRCSWGILCLHS